MLDARERLPDDDRQQPPGRLRLRPARRGVRLGGHGGVGEPARAHRRSCATADGHARCATLPYFFLERYIAELPARVGGVRRRRRARARRRRSTGADARAPLVIGLAALALAARGPPGRASRRSDGMSDPFADQRLDGKVVVVTGSTQGLGAAIARRAAALGAAGIVVCGRDRRARRGASAASWPRSAARPCSCAADLAERGRLPRDRPRVRGALRPPRRAGQRGRPEQPRHARRHQRRAVGPALRRQRRARRSC